MRTLKFFMAVVLMAVMGSLSSCSKTPAKAPVTTNSNLVVIEVRLVPPPKIEYPASDEVEDYINEPLHFVED